MTRFDSLMLLAALILLSWAISQAEAKLRAGRKRELAERIITRCQVERGKKGE